MARRSGHLIHFLPLFSRFLIAAVFIASAAGKLHSPSEFDFFVRSIGLVDLVHPRILLYSSIGLEALLAGLLLYPRTSSMGVLLAFSALLLFTCILVVASFSEVKAPCGCFGDLLGESTLDSSILRNMVLLLIIAGAASIQVSRFQKG